MTTTILRPRFAAGYADKNITVPCNGINHTDHARPGMCLTCGKSVARKPDGSIFDVREYRTEAGYERTAIMCYRAAHTCSVDIVPAFRKFWAEQLEQGKIMHDQHVTVVRGRKVPQGTTGVVFYRVIDQDFYGADIVKVGIRDVAGDTFFVQESYLQATHTIPVISAEEAAEIDPAHADEYLEGDDPAPAPRIVTARRQGSHAACDHEPTKAARARCRKAKGV